MAEVVSAFLCFISYRLNDGGAGVKMHPHFFYISQSRPKEDVTFGDGRLADWITK